LQLARLADLDIDQKQSIHSTIFTEAIFLMLHHTKTSTSATSPTASGHSPWRFDLHLRAEDCTAVAILSRTAIPAVACSSTRSGE
jgi:hypothetical protein